MAVSSTFSGKTAIITGGTSGIGLALAHELATRGAHVVAASSSAKNVERARVALTGSGSEVHRLDVRDRAAFRELAQYVARSRGGVDYLFNNAGIAVLGEARDHTDQDWDDLLDVNLRGVVNGVCAVYPQMIAQGTGHIVNMASLGGIVATPFNSGYTATKFGVVGLSQALRFEAARYGVRVSVVCPAYVETGMAQSSRCRHLDRDRVLREVPTPRDSAESCARAVLRGVARNKDVITPHAAAPLAFIHRHMPWLTRLMMRKLSSTVAQLRDSYAPPPPVSPAPPSRAQLAARHRARGDQLGV